MIEIDEDRLVHLLRRESILLALYGRKVDTWEHYLDALDNDDYFLKLVEMTDKEVLEAFKKGELNNK